ncbi:MAG: dethiobiotin synthase [Bacteroidota bacterium]
MNYFITGIGTNVGKTLVSAVLTEALEADYWKPIQSGTIEGSDSATIKSLISNSKTRIHSESYLLKQPLSPHFAAKIDGVEIDLNKIKKPETANHLMVEGAGGILVPLNDKHYVIDIAKCFPCEIVLVISDYLGCINHSLLSIDYLQRNNFKIHALIFNGQFDMEVKEAIIQYAPIDKIISVPTLQTLSKQTVKEAAALIKAQL